MTGTQSHFPFGEDAGTSGTVEKHRFTTYENDAESGTNYAVNRQHGASTGRFMRPDPMAGTVSFPQSLNRYSYTINDPVTLSDPLGLNPVAPPGTYVDQLGVKYRWDGTTLWGPSYDGGTVFSGGGPTRTTDDQPRAGVDVSDVSDPSGAAGYTYPPGTPTGPVSKMDCSELIRLINELATELESRAADLVADDWHMQWYNWSKSNPLIINGKNLGSVEGHQDKFSETQERLQKAISRYRDRCNGGPPIPRMARGWAYAPTPSPAYQANSHVPTRHELRLYDARVGNENFAYLVIGAGALLLTGYGVVAVGGAGSGAAIGGVALAF
ncbi:MAG: hypothetical protein IT175_09445 [Acidobacteria bacterium]|nr:hypothetical protein [Acidobacteriota bacterium]